MLDLLTHTRYTVYIETSTLPWDSSLRSAFFPNSAILRMQLLGEGPGRQTSCFKRGWRTDWVMKGFS